MVSRACLLAAWLEGLVVELLREFRGVKPQVGNSVYIDQASVVIGQVTIGDDCSVWPLAVLRGDMHTITIGNRTNVQDGAVLHITHAGPYNASGWPLSIGDDVTIGHQAVVHGCTVGSRVLIGMGAVLMDGVVVEDDVIVAAGALVPPGKVLRSGWIYKGNPCQASRELTPEERQFFQYSAKTYVDLKNQYMG